MFHACACLVMSHLSALFANVQRGRKVVYLFSMLQDTIGHHKKGGDCWEGEPAQFNEDDFDDVQSYTNTLYHCFKLSPKLIFCVGVVYLGLHVNQSWTESDQLSNSWMCQMQNSLTDYMRALHWCSENTFPNCCVLCFSHLLCLS